MKQNLVTLLKIVILTNSLLIFALIGSKINKYESSDLIKTFFHHWLFCPASLPNMICNGLLSFGHANKKTKEKER